MYVCNPVEEKKLAVGFMSLRRSFAGGHYFPAMGSTKEVTIFDKIVRGEVSSKRVFEDDLVLAFRDINPVAPHHILLVPKDKDGLKRLSDAEEKHASLLGHMMVTVGKIIKQEKISSYRLVVNDGSAAGQTVFHLHMHIIAGRSLSWPPG